MLHFLQKNLGKQKKVFRNAENLAKKCLSLPIEPTLSKKEVQYIVKKLNSF